MCKLLRHTCVARSVHCMSHTLLHVTRTMACVVFLTQHSLHFCSVRSCTCSRMPRKGGKKKGSGGKKGSAALMPIELNSNMNNFTSTPDAVAVTVTKKNTVTVLNGHGAQEMELEQSQTTSVVRSRGAVKAQQAHCMSAMCMCSQYVRSC